MAVSRRLAAALMAGYALWGGLLAAQTPPTAAPTTRPAAEPAAAPTTGPASAPAANNHLDLTRRITLNFQRADINLVLNYLSQVTGVTFLPYTLVTGEVTIVNQEQLTVAEAFDVLNAVLKVKGATCIVNETKFVKIVALGDARRQDVPTGEGALPPDLPAGETFLTQVVRLRRASARDLVRELRNIVGPYGDLSAASQGNCLILTDTASNIRRMLQIIEQVDSDPEALVEMRVFVLTYADARKVADILRQVFVQATTTRTGGGQRPVFMMFRGGGGEGGGQPAEEGPSGGIAVPLRVTVEDRLNAVVVVAGADQIRQAEGLIKQLDVAPPAPRLVSKVVVLKYGDATEVVKILKEVFQPRRTTTGRTGTTGGTAGFFAQRMAEAFGGRGGRGGGADSGGGTAEAGTPTLAGVDEELVVTADRRTNTIILVGTREQVDAAEQIIMELARDPGEQMDMLLIKLNNARAQDIQRALTQLFQNATQAARRLESGTTGGRAPAAAAADTAVPGLVGETIVVAEQTSNSLLIVSNPRNFERIKQYIADLDRAKPQVFIKALIGEITLDNDTKLGVDFSFLDEPFYHGRGTANWRMNFGLGANLTGGSVTISYDDIELVIRALETEGKLNVLSRPHILTLDNQRARIADGERVPFIRSTRETDQGSVFNVIQYEDIGIILEVTPQINLEGSVNLTVRQEISRITGRTVPISEGVDAPTFSSRSAETTVAIHDGQTIVIGGLIADSEVATVDEVPFLGKLPLIGYAFRSSVITKQRKELVLILTPHVIRDEAQLRAVSEQERVQSTFSQAALTEGRGAGERASAKAEPPAAMPLGKADDDAPAKPAGG